MINKKKKNHIPRISHPLIAFKQVPKYDRRVSSESNLDRLLNVLKISKHYCAS